MSDRVRLHITPFNPDLLDRFIPAAIKPVATDLSFHTVETFPERGFGFVELPVTEAQKLKNKFNGMTLKGTKVKIEEARKEKKRKVEAEDGDVELKKVKKSKKGEGVLEGHELPEGRIVKRGWTENVGKKGKDGKVKKEEKKMKFKTLVPPNAVPLEDDAEGKKGKKDKKEKRERTDEEKAERAAKRAQKKEVLVKEFANTTKLNFPNSAGDKKHKHFEEGVGWVDEEGTVLEPEPPSKKRKREKREKKEKKAAEKLPTPEPQPEPESESEVEVERGIIDEPKSENEQDVEMEEAPSVPADKVDTSSEDDKASTASESDSDNDSLDDHLNQAESNTVSNGATAQQRKVTPTPVGEVVEEVDELDAEVAKEIHPLEALYKRSSSKPAPIDTAFSFFAVGADDEDDDPIVEQQILIPQTPHTKEDFEWRSTRSAAPTPDTAAIGKKFNFPPTAINEDDDEDDDDEVEKELSEGKGEESEFRKWFYANRGDLNRGWKKRRKEERKVVRQRENRRASRRVA